MTAVSASGLSCLFGTVRAVDNVDLHIAAGEFVAIEGPSGCGKSTLLNLIAGLESPTAGSLSINEQDVVAMSERERTLFRRRHIGVVFQLYDLLPSLMAWQNVAVPALLDGGRLKAEEARAKELLGRVGLGDRTDHRPSELSGGEQQRVAIARSLMNEPDLVLADEPTGALDSVTGDEVLSVLRELAADGQTVIMVTHEARAAAYADRSIYMLDGAVEPEPASAL